MNNERSVPRCDQVYLHLSIFISFVPILRLSECGLFWYFWFWAWFFHLKLSKMCKKFFCRLEILSTRNISESNFSKLRFWTVDKYIFIYGEDIYLLRSCSTWLANMINLIWCSHSGPDPVRWCGPIPGSYPDWDLLLPFFCLLRPYCAFNISSLWYEKMRFFLQLMCYAEK